MFDVFPSSFFNIRQASSFVFVWQGLRALDLFKNIFSPVICGQFLHFLPPFVLKRLVFLSSFLFDYFVIAGD
jgi:hypothetical protein